MTDFEKTFIQCIVFNYDILKELGDENEVKAKGKVMTKGKDYVRNEVLWQNKKYPFFYLPRLLGNAGHNPETMRYNSVLLLKSGQNMTAVHVDEMIGNQEVVVKNIGPQLARVSGIAGATVYESVKPGELPAFQVGSDWRAISHRTVYATDRKPHE